MATQFANGKIVTDGLVLALNAADKNSYPGSGTTWFDTSGRGNHCILYNGPAFSTTYGGLITFDGVDDYGLIAYNASSPLFSSISSYTIMSAFINLNTDGNWHHLFGFADGGNNIDEWYNGPNGTGCYHNNSGQTVNSTTSLRNAGMNIWCHAYTGGDNRLYKNAVLDVSGAQNSIADPTYGFGIARTPDSLAYFSNYQLSLLLVYNRALTASEILQNYNAQKSRFNLT